QDDVNAQSLTDLTRTTFPRAITQSSPVLVSAILARVVDQLILAQDVEEWLKAATRTGVLRKTGETGPFQANRISLLHMPCTNSVLKFDISLDLRNLDRCVRAILSVVVVVIVHERLSEWGSAVKTNNPVLGEVGDVVATVHAEQVKLGCGQS